MTERYPLNNGGSAESPLAAMRLTELIAEVPTGGAWPRHLALFGDHLYVANERSHTVTTFRVDPDSGVPRLQGEPTGEPSPTCLLRWIPAIGDRRL